MIVVAGLPSSGNYLVSTHIRRGVMLRDRLSGHPEEIVHIWHGNGDGAYITAHRPAGERLMFVIPVRSEPRRLRSVKRRSDNGRLKIFPFDVEMMRQGLARRIVTEEAPYLNVSYEALVADPEVIGRALFDWLDLEWVQWPLSLPEGRPAHEGPVFNVTV